MFGKTIDTEKVQRSLSLIAFQQMTAPLGKTTPTASPLEQFAQKKTSRKKTNTYAYYTRSSFFQYL